MIDPGYETSIQEDVWWCPYPNCDFHGTGDEVDRHTDGCPNRQRIISRLEVFRGGPRHWYVQEVTTLELVAEFKTRRMAQEAVDDGNEIRGFPRRAER